MNVLVAHGQKLEHYPPVRSLVEVLLRNGHSVTLVTKCGEKPFDREYPGLKLVRLKDNENRKSLLNALSYFGKKRAMKRAVEREMKSCDLLWTTTDSTVRDLGKLVCRYPHVMQLMELIEDIPALPGLDRPGLNIKKYARQASRVVVPEYNRAHIQKVWWELKELPTVLPNKMASVTIGEPPEYVRQILEELDNEPRKIILYQGSFRGDRELDLYAKAVESLPDCTMYIMGNDTPERKALCEKFPGIKYIPFIAPPYHLLVTQRAHIGLLPYIPGKVGFNSVLNAVYCAPNKIFEFSGYGIPMIGNDVPGITIPFESCGIGKVRRGKSAEEIARLIEEINKNYEQMQASCHAYFESVDLDAIVNGCLDGIIADKE